MVEISALLERVAEATGELRERILAKLRDASWSPYLRHVDTFGVERAKMLVEQAASFGSKVAENWISEGFSRYLAFLGMNTRRLFTYEK